MRLFLSSPVRWCYYYYVYYICGGWNSTIYKYIYIRTYTVATCVLSHCFWSASCVLLLLHAVMSFIVNSKYSVCERIEHFSYYFIFISPIIILIRCWLSSLHYYIIIIRDYLLRFIYSLLYLSFFIIFLCCCTIHHSYTTWDSPLLFDRTQRDTANLMIGPTSALLE